MPTVADLERLRALNERLTPLANATQGELIRAEDWNTLVGAVSEIARVVLAEDREAAPAAHEHPDQVTSGWLDPRLRALIERGPLSDPAAEARLQALEQRVDRLQARVEALFGSVGEVRDRVTDVTTRDLVRQSEVVNVRRVVEGLGDSRESVRELRETLGVLQRDVSTAVTIGQRLTVNGQPIDFNDFDLRLRQADDLRARLTGPDGGLLDANALENRLTQLTNTLVTQETLDQALETVRRDISPGELADLEGRLGNRLTEQVNTSFATFSDQLRAENNTRFAEIDGRVASRISDSIPSITTSVLNTIRPEVDSRRNTTRQELEESIKLQVTTSSDTLRGEYTQQIEGLRVDLASQVGSELDRQLPDRLAVITRRIGQVEETLQPVRDRVTRLEASMDNVRARIDVLGNDLISTNTQVRSDLIAEMDRRDRLQATQFDQRLATLDATLTQRTNTAITDSRRVILDEARTAARETARLEIAPLETRLRTDLNVISRNIVTDVVRTEINAATPNLTESITNRLRLPPG